MTTQLRATPASAPLSAKVNRRATKVPDDQAADQFAAMFASLCVAPTPQLISGPKDQAVAAVDSIATPEIAPAATVIALQTPAPEAGTEVPAAVTKDVSLPLGPPAIPGSSAQMFEGPPLPLTKKEINLAVDKVEPAPAPLMTLSPPLIRPAPGRRAVDPIELAAEAAPPNVRIRSAEDVPVAGDPGIVATMGVAEQNLQSEAARRVANLVAGYLAEATSTDREAGPAAGVKAMLAGNGFDLRGEDSERNSKSNSQLQPAALVGEVSFAATVHGFQANGSTSSIQAQTISQIIAQAENIPALQTRSLRLRLRPEELGQIDIQLTRDAQGRISAHISAERETAREVLSQSLHQLREMLSRGGLTVDKLQVHTETGHNHEAHSNAPQPQSPTTNSITPNETEAGGQLPADTEKLLSLRA